MAKTVTLPMTAETMTVVAQTLREILGDPKDEWPGLTAWGGYIVKGWGCGCGVHYDFGKMLLGHSQIELTLCPQHKPIIAEKLKGVSSDGEGVNPADVQADL
jgi:hypothetical protein